MIRLTSLLNEIVMSGKSYEFAIHKLFPISGRIGDRIWDKQRVRGFHTTRPDNIDGLKSMSGKRKSLSIATNVDMWFVSNLTGPVSRGMIVWIEGDVLFKSHRDLGSRPDENGRRWITLRTVSSQLFRTSSSQLFNDYSNYLDKDTEYQRAYNDAVLATKTLQKWTAFASPKDDKKELARLTINEKTAKARLIKAHMDSSWSWLTSGTNLVKMQMYARDVSNSGVLTNNEYIVTNIKPIDAIIFDNEVDFSPSAVREFETLKKKIKSAISGQLIIAPSTAKDPSAAVQQKFYKDRVSIDGNI